MKQIKRTDCFCTNQNHGTTLVYHVYVIELNPLFSWRSTCEDHNVFIVLFNKIEFFYENRILEVLCKIGFLYENRNFVKTQNFCYHTKIQSNITNHFCDLSGFVGFWLPLNRFLSVMNGIHLFWEFQDSPRIWFVIKVCVHKIPKQILGGVYISFCSVDKEKKPKTWDFFYLPTKQTTVWDRDIDRIHLNNQCTTSPLAPSWRFRPDYILAEFT